MATVSAPSKSAVAAPWAGHVALVGAPVLFALVVVVLPVVGILLSLITGCGPPS
jgi:hypothetical protein